MKAVVFLALLGVAAARPQFLHPGIPLITNFNSAEIDGNTKLIQSPLTYTYPNTFPNYNQGYPTTFVNTLPTTYPITYSGFPYNYPMVNPVVSSPVQAQPITNTRTKRSADAEPEAEADPFTVYSGIPTVPFTGTTTYNYPGYPAVSPYSVSPYRASPYSTFPYAPFTYASYPTLGYPYTNVVKTA